MKSNFDILNTLYKVLNIPEIISEINGRIYKTNVPKTSQNEDIEINVLTNPNQYVQNGYANVNLYCVEDSLGRANTKRLADLSNKIVPLLKDTKKDGFYFQIESQGGVFKDQERDNMYFFNLKINYQTL